MPGLGGVWDEAGSGQPWERAEVLAVHWMKELGFADSKRTPGTGDRGVDVLAPDAAAQVKLQGKAIGSPDVQRLRGAAHGRQNAVFYSYSGYTVRAIEAANSAGVALFHVRENTPQPVNPVAGELVRRAERMSAEAAKERAAKAVAERRALRDAVKAEKRAGRAKAMAEWRARRSATKAARESQQVAGTQERARQWVGSSTRGAREKARSDSSRWITARSAWPPPSGRAREFNEDPDNKRQSGVGEVSSQNVWPPPSGQVLRTMDPRPMRRPTDRS